MPKENVGLSFQEAAQEALAEEATAIESSNTSSADDVADNSDTPVAEQSTVESTEPVSLFDRSSDVEDNGEQPHNDDSLLSLTINGQAYTVEELEQRMTELEAGNMRQDDYTRKTQEHSEKLKEFDKAVTLWEAIQENPQDTIRRLWQGVSQGKPIAQTVTPEPSTNIDIEALIEAKLQEKFASDPRIQALEDQRLTKRVDDAFSAIEDDRDVVLTDPDRQFVLEQAQIMGINDLFAVFDILMYREQLKAQQRANAGRVATANTGKPGSPDDVDEPPVGGSFRQIMEHELRRENMLDAVFNI